MSEIQDQIDDAIAPVSGATRIHAGDDYVLVHDTKSRDMARATLDAAGLKTVSTLLAPHIIWEDGRFHGDRVQYRVVETDDGNEFILVTSRDGEDGLYDANPIDFLMGRVEDWANCTHHPCRVRDAFKELGAKANKVDGTYDDDEREHDLNGEDFWLVIDGEEQPAKFTALVFKADAARVAWRDCSSGTDDHDIIYLVNAGPHAGQYLRDYASRYEGSADYEATLLDVDQLPSWARVQLGLDVEDED